MRPLLENSYKLLLVEHLLSKVCRIVLSHVEGLWHFFVTIGHNAIDGD